MAFSTNDKRNGAIIGHALGDALGAPVEFYPYGHYTGVLDTPIVRFTRAYGKQVSSVGQITDDAEMAFVLMETLNSGYTKEKAVVNYMLWANNNYDGCKGNMPFMGKNTRNLFIAPKPTYKVYNNRFNKHYSDEITKENSDNFFLDYDITLTFLAKKINTNSKEDIFNLESIKKIAIQHRLRFLPTKYFKNEIPKEAIFKIKEIEKENNITVEQFFILAPSQAFDLEDCNKDPLLFIPLKNKEFLLVHKWGDDLGWFKKLLALPLKSLESMIATVGITAFLIAAFTPTWLILNGAEVDMGYFGYHRIAWFLYSFIMLCSLSTFMCFSQSIYPSEYQWDKKTYN